MKNWKNYDPNTILNTIDKGGIKILLNKFWDDYEERFKIRPKCSSCQFQNYYNNMINFKETNNMNNKNFQLKAKYHGASFFGTSFSNISLTDQEALYLLVNHPRGKDLFSLMPENVDSMIESYIRKNDEEKIKEQPKKVSKSNVSNKKKK